MRAVCSFFSNIHSILYNGERNTGNSAGRLQRVCIWKDVGAYRRLLWNMGDDRRKPLCHNRSRNNRAASWSFYGGISRGACTSQDSFCHEDRNKPACRYTLCSLRLLWSCSYCPVYRQSIWGWRKQPPCNHTDTEHNDTSNHNKSERNCYKSSTLLLQGRFAGTGSHSYRDYIQSYSSCCKVRDTGIDSSGYRKSCRRDNGCNTCIRQHSCNTGRPS